MKIAKYFWSFCFFIFLICLINFDYILNSENISPMAIADMKELMSSLSKDKEPITIVFQTDDKSKIDDAFIGNEIRIPCKIDLDEIK